MPTGRTPRTSLVVALATLVCAASAATASGGIPAHIVFPVVGKVSYSNDYGDPRWQGSHEGNDVMGRRMQYAVAAEAGRVEKRWTGGYSCYLFLHGRSGTDYWYIHLNNDKPGPPKNDNQGGCRNGISWPVGLRQGQRVRAGQIVGFVGDSGDANGIQPHLHFEVHPNGGGPVNPFQHLNRARRLIYAVPSSVESISLKMRGIVREAGEQLVVRTVLVHPLGGRYFGVSKAVAIDVPSNTIVERRGPGGQVRDARLGSAQPGERVLVWTNASAPTLATKRGLPGAWDAARIRLLD
jgi:hypothetical protein